MTARTLATDDFNRANNADLGAAWDATNGQNAMQITANCAQQATIGADNGESNNSVAFPNDQWSEAVFGPNVKADGVGTGYGPAVRMTSDGSLTHYRMIGSGAGYELVRHLAGASLSLSSGAGTTFAAADALYLEFVGSTPVHKKNGAPFGAPTSNSAIAGGRAGVCYSSTEAVASDGITSWQAGDFVAEVLPLEIPRPVRRFQFERFMNEEEAFPSELDPRTWCEELATA